MIFGSDEFFYKIKDAIKEADSTIFDEVFRVIDADLAFLAHMPHDAFDEVMQDIRLSVWKSMGSYIMKSESMHPNQRNSWLREIAKKRIADYYRKKHKQIDEITDSEWQIADDEFRSLFDTYIDPETDIEKQYLKNDDRLNMRKELFDICKYICESVKSPESIIVFFFNKLIIPYLRGTRSGSPKEIRELFSGKTIMELRDMLVSELQMILCCEIPDEVFKELDFKIVQNPESKEMVFMMSDSRISDISYKVQNNIKKRF